MVTRRKTGVWRNAEAFATCYMDTPKQPSSIRPFCQYLNSAKLLLAYLNEGACRGKAAGCSLTSYLEPIVQAIE